MAKPEINKERVQQTFFELVRIDSPSGEEAGVAAYCKEQLEQAGCQVRLDDSSSLTGSNTGNLIATLPAKGVSNQQGASGDGAPLPLFFSAHMDTVDPGRGVKPHLKDGYVYSDGTTVLGGDDKVGIASIIELVRCLHESDANEVAYPEIRILLSVQEEKSLVGVKAMDARMFADVQGALCYVLDAAGKPGLVVNGAPYQYSYTARYKGLAAHAGIAPQEGISAIRAAAMAVAALPQGRLDEQTTTNIGIIEGGTATNVVAAECSLRGEARSHSEARLEELKAQITQILEAATQGELCGAGPASVDISWEVNYEGFYAAPDSPQVARALAAAESLGFEAQTEISGGGADTNILASYGLAAVSLGSGMEHIHSTDERLALDDLWNLATWALSIATS